METAWLSHFPSSESLVLTETVSSPLAYTPLGASWGTSLTQRTSCRRGTHGCGRSRSPSRCRRRAENRSRPSHTPADKHEASQGLQLLIKTLEWAVCGFHVSHPPLSQLHLQLGVTERGPKRHFGEQTLTHKRGTGSQSGEEFNLENHTVRWVENPVPIPQHCSQGRLVASRTQAPAPGQRLRLPCKLAESETE